MQAYTITQYTDYTIFSIDRVADGIEQRPNNTKILTPLWHPNKVSEGLQARNGMHVCNELQEEVRAGQ